MGSLASRKWAQALAVLVFAGIADAQGSGKRYTPWPAASDYGYRFHDLFWLITALCVVSFALVLILMIIPIVRDRDRPGKKATYDHGSGLGDKRLTAVISVITFVVLDAWVLVIAMRDLREAYWAFPAEEDAAIYRVQVLGQQWAWSFRGEGLDGEFGTADDILETNQLTVPLDRPVSLQMTSKDVIHALFLPEMRMKKDVNPGDINALWFKPIKAGDFTILCAELCGYAHYMMHGKVTVLEQDVFDAWEEEASHMGNAAYDADDQEAQWAWEWEDYSS